MGERCGEVEVACDDGKGSSGDVELAGGRIEEAVRRRRFERNVFPGSRATAQLS